MNILVLHAHWNNRGDEAAIRAMIDELSIRYENAIIKVVLLSDNTDGFDYSDNITCEITEYPKRRDFLFECIVNYMSAGNMSFTSRSSKFINLLKEADIVLHAPGGPSIGSIYKGEERYLFRLLLAKRMNIPYVFFAPSMGPFDGSRYSLRNVIRRKVLNGAGVFCLRESLSKEYVKQLGGVREPHVTLDSAFQHQYDRVKYEKQFSEYKELKDFVESGKRVIGITITDLLWNPKYQGENAIDLSVKETFIRMIDYLTELGYGVLFIPQLFGAQQDSLYMGEFSNEDCFVMSDKYDCYFQQHIIGKMYALIGMRYHSNIFSAKMGCPFISISYEQKMLGFMKKMGLEKHCIDVRQLSYDNLQSMFMEMISNYSEYSRKLKHVSRECKVEAYRTTQYVIDYLENNHKYSS